MSLRSGIARQTGAWCKLAAVSVLRVGRSCHSDGKKLMEEVALSHFLEAYRLATGEEFVDVLSFETPDFLARDSAGGTVGIELTQVKFPPSDMSWRRIMGEEWADDSDSFLRVLKLLDVKEKVGHRGV